ncbi:MAG: hypothetical protein AAFZ15_24210 [Bacteroidota bacterium]
MEATRRYPGAKPFSPDQRGIFFGRQQDIDDLAEMINIEQLVVLYSKSGLGKSSLLNAGVIPKLAAEDDIDTFTFRFGAYNKEGHLTPLEITTEQLAFDGQSNLLDKILPNENSLWYHLKNRQMAEKGKRSYLLIFDQFEELFTYPEKQVNNFAKQLAEAMYTVIPGRYREVMESKIHGDQNQLFLSGQELKDLHEEMEIKVLMAIRSDRMSLLNQVSDFLPNILKSCYELKALNVEQAEDAILTPAYLKDPSFESPTFDYSDEAIETTLDFLTKGNTHKIASFQLQILCESLERKVIEQGLKVIEIEHLGDIENLYKNYYDNQISLIPGEEDQLAARRLIEEGLIFEEEERRLTLYEGQIYKTFNINDSLLRKLVNCHLIRSEPSSQGDGFNYEISHDSLVAPILKSKEKRKAKEIEDARVEEERKQTTIQKKKLLEERKKRRQARRFAAFGFLLFAVALVAGFIALIQSREAVKAKSLAENALVEVRASRDSIIRIQKEARAANFEKFRDGGKIAMQEDIQDALEQFQLALEFADTKADSSEILQLIRESRGLAAKRALFEEYLAEADSSFNAEIYLSAMESYLKAKNLDMDAQHTTIVNERISKVTAQMTLESVELISHAKIYAEAEDCRLAKGKLNTVDSYKYYINTKNLTRTTRENLRIVQQLCPQ